MPATFVVEDGSGKVDANSYASVAAADQYHLDFGQTTWDALTDAVKEMALRKATRWMDIEYTGRWIGERSNETQAQAWPRTNAEDYDGYTYAYNQVPTKLVQATSELAFYALTEDLAQNLSSGTGELMATSTKVGPIETEKRYAAPARQQKAYTVAETLIRPLVNDSHQAQLG